ncbi:GEVED domain-containing protein [Flavobacterium sp. A45]|uniref:GEVED domain-containing protein n=1 Tax=Flavobacterium sp. A45 TaxID=1945862 RepID=UPI00098776E3|nr:GEVED domain-containing protein [Flavobacterium sp. A45]OOG75172.1 hypothetical protein B0E44_05345 [Flavobacterium sp. A45]
MKKIKHNLMLCFSIITLGLNAQEYKSMMYDNNVNFYDVVKEAERYFDGLGPGKKHEKGSGYKQYQRWVYENESSYYPTGVRNNVDLYAVFNTSAKAKSQSIFSKRSSSNKIMQSEPWVARGPDRIGTVGSHQSVGLGRIEDFYVSANEQTMYVCSISGGFWRSIDSGDTWACTTDALVATGVNTIAVDPDDINHILINVQNAKNYTSEGIYESRDGGLTWNVTNFNPNNLNWAGLGNNGKVFKIAFHPDKDNLVFVGTTEGLYRSTDCLATTAGYSVIGVGAAGIDVKDIVFHPTDDEVMYVSTPYNTVLYRSDDRGLTFKQMKGRLDGSKSEPSIDVSADCADCVFAYSEEGLWRSTDKGDTWTRQRKDMPEKLLLGGVCVSDDDSEKMIVMGQNVYYSDDKGVTFAENTKWDRGDEDYANNKDYVHADIRRGKFINNNFWVSTDGFLAKSTWNNNKLEWKLFEGQSIRQNYALSVSQSNADVTVCGAQDAGSSLRDENGWIEFSQGDGGASVIHPLNDKWAIASSQYGNRYRTIDGGKNRKNVTPEGKDKDGDWVAPLLIDPHDQMTVYSFTDDIHKSNDFGETWEAVSTNIFGEGTANAIDVAAISEFNSDIIVTHNEKIRLSTDDGVTFEDIRNGLPTTAITDVAFYPMSPGRIVVVYGNHEDGNDKVYKSSDNGVTWTSITHDLNQMPIHSVVVDRYLNIYVGTERGVYTRNWESNDNWQVFDNNLPNVAIRDLAIVTGANTLRAATWGRGLWEVPLAEKEDYPKIIKTSITNTPTDVFPAVGMPQRVKAKIESAVFAIDSVNVQYSINSRTYNNNIKMTILGNPNNNEWMSDTALAPNAVIGDSIYFKVKAYFTDNKVVEYSETYGFMYKIRASSYCVANGEREANMAWQPYITKVEIDNVNDFSNDSQYSQGEYFYYTNAPIKLKKRETNTLGVTVRFFGFGTAYDHQKVGAWIDFNRDGDFTDAGEEIVMEDLQGAGQVDNWNGFSSGIIVIPEGAVENEYLKMRIRNVANEDNVINPNICDTQVGEVEEYDVIILPDYCDANGELAAAPNLYSDIRKVDITNNATAKNIFTKESSYNSYISNQYTHYNDEIELQADTNYNIKITTPFYNSWNDHNVAVWIDFNKDGDFYDAAEEINMTAFAAPNNYHTGESTGTINIPASAVKDKTLKMRIRKNYSNTGVINPETCGTQQGEVEDYNITIPSNNLAAKNVNDKNKTLEDSVENQVLHNIVISPNPASDILYVSYNSKECDPANYYLYDTLGNLVKHSNLETIEENKKVIKLMNQSSGLYLLKLTNKEGITIGLKSLIIKN